MVNAAQTLLKYLESSAIIFMAIICTITLSEYFYISSILSLIGLSLTLSILPERFFEIINLNKRKTLELVYIGGFLSFDIRLNNAFIMYAAALLATCIYHITGPHIVKFGGRLGTQAFLTCFIIYLVMFL